MRDVEEKGVIYRICYVCRNKFELNQENFYRNKTKNKGFELCCKRCSKQRLSKYKCMPKNKPSKKEYNEYRNKWREERFEKGLCKVCKEPRLKNQKTCYKHYLMDLARKHLGSTKFWKELDTLFQQQEGKCAISGLPIAIGENASIDHKKPLSKYPDDLYELSNLQWVDERVNRMKLNMEYDEFIFIIQTILDYNSK